MTNDNYSGPGRSCYLIGFMLDGFHYKWSDDIGCYFSKESNCSFDSLPVGAYNLEWSYIEP